MVRVGISRAVRGEGADGLDGYEVWKMVRSQGREDITVACDSWSQWANSPLERLGSTLARGIARDTGLCDYISLG